MCRTKLLRLLTSKSLIMGKAIGIAHIAKTRSIAGANKLSGNHAVICYKLTNVALTSNTVPCALFDHCCQNWV